MKIKNLNLFLALAALSLSSAAPVWGVTLRDLEKQSAEITTLLGNKYAQSDPEDTESLSAISEKAFGLVAFTEDDFSSRENLENYIKKLQSFGGFVTAEIKKGEVSYALKNIGESIESNINYLIKSCNTYGSENFNSQNASSQKKQIKESKEDEKPSSKLGFFVKALQLLTGGSTESAEKISRGGSSEQVSPGGEEEQIPSNQISPGNSSGEESTFGKNPPQNSVESSNPFKNIVESSVSNISKQDSSEVELKELEKRYKKDLLEVEKIWKPYDTARKAYAEQLFVRNWLGETADSNDRAKFTEVNNKYMEATTNLQKIYHRLVGQYIKDGYEMRDINFIRELNRVGPDGMENHKVVELPTKSSSPSNVLLSEKWEQ